MSAFDALIFALADGQTMRDAALAARMPSAHAIREARSVGWPDLTAVRAAADEIRERLNPPPNDLPGGDTTVPPRKPDPVPLEPDVEAAMTAGARATDRARASLATSAEARDAAAEQALAERERQPQPAAEATDAKSCGMADHHLEQDQDQPIEAGDHVAAGGVWGTAIPCSACGGQALVLDPDELQPGPPPPGYSDRHHLDAMAGHGLAAAVPPDELIPERSGTDALLIEDAAAVLQLVDRLAVGDERIGALSPEQRQRTVALREAHDLVPDGDGAVLEWLALAHFIVDGSVPDAVLFGRPA